MGEQFEFLNGSQFDRDVRMIKGAAREKVDAEKNPSDYIISDNFPRSAQAYFNEQMSKPEDIFILESSFIDAGNHAIELADRYLNGGVRNLRGEALPIRLKDFTDYAKSLRDSDKEYIKLTGKRHPDYDKFLNYSVTVFKALESEIDGRKTALNNLLNDIERN